MEPARVFHAPPGSAAIGIIAFNSVTGENAFPASKSSDRCAVGSTDCEGAAVLRRD